MATSLKMTRGDSKTLRFTVSNLPPTGLEGYTFWFTAKLQVADADGAAVFQKTSAHSDFTVVTVGSDTVPGVVTVQLQPADTASQPDYVVVLLWDFQVEESTGYVTTADSGTLTITPDVTRSL